VAALTWAAGAAADPRMRQPAVADLDSLSVRAECDDLADIFVTECNRKLHAAIGKAHPLAAAQIEPAIGEVQIAVADARGQDLQQNLCAFRLRRGLLIELQRLTANADLEHAHRLLLSPHRWIGPTPNHSPRPPSPTSRMPQNRALQEIS